MGLMAAALLGCALGPRPIETIPLPEATGANDPRDNVTGSADGEGCPNGVCLDGGTPGMPERRIAEASIFYAETEPLTLLLVGTAGAMPGAGRLFVSNYLRSASQESIDVGDDGSFVRPILAAIGDAIELDFEQSGAIVESLSLTLYDGSVAAYAANDTLDEAAAPPPPSGSGLGQITANASGGLVTVSGTASGLVPGITVVVANLTRNLARYGRVADDGTFTVSLTGESGDQLRIFAVEPAASNGSGAPAELVVP